MSDSDLHKQPWHVKAKTLIADCLPWLRVVKDHVELPNGTEIEDFYRIEMPAYTMVFALTEDQEVLMIEHYKHGAGMVSLELPAGYVESNEQDNPQQSAQRELLEETGYAASNWQHLGQFFIDGNRGCGSVDAYLVTNAHKVGQQQLEAAEIIALKPMPIDTVRSYWKSGQIPNVVVNAIIGLSLATLEDKNVL